MWRLGLVTFLVLLAFGVLWGVIWIWGYSQPIISYKKPNFPETGLYFKNSNPENLDRWLIGVYYSITENEGELFCFDQPCKNKLSNYTDIKLLLRLDINKEGIHEKFVSTFDKIPNENLILTSVYPVVIKAIKKLKPRWTYGLSSVEMTRMKIFESLFLIHVPRIEGDIWISPLDVGQKNLVTVDLEKELRRRSKSLIIEEIEDKESLDLAQRLGADAVVIEEELYNRLKSNL